MILLPQLHNGQAIALKDVPELAMPDFRTAVLERVRKGRRVSSLFGMPDGDEVMLILVLTNDAQGMLELCRTRVRDSYPALTPDVPQAHWFEREIAEQWGIVPQGHPWLKPIRFHKSYNGGRDAWGRAKTTPIEPGVTDYFRVEGDEIHEVAVGPVHAGIIEPGHFRFQCHGENVLHLEIELGYQHRGIERAIVARASSPCSWRGHPGLALTTPVPSKVQGRGALATQAAPGSRMVPGDSKGETPSPLSSATDPRTAHYMETLAGDTTVGHATAYASVMEALGDATPSLRAHAVRAIALELERLANHTGDLGALAGDVGYLPTASYCGRLRGDFLNMTALLCGNRFGRGLVRPGGVRFDLTPEAADGVLTRLHKTYEAVQNAVDLLWETPSVMSRFDGTGVVSRQDAIRLGLVGPAARASGVELDVRSDLPWGVYQSQLLPAVSLHTGDVAARAYVRWFEIQKSIEFITDAIHALPAGPVQQEVPPPAKEHLAVALVEGWRGEICHVAVTDNRGRLRHYKITDPSFHNWFGLAMALRGQQISDFPLCNKSFNLSYCGHDL
jgi:Ni,Fe-hydrogenase III large subunit